MISKGTVASSKPKEDFGGRSVLGPRAHLALFCWCQVLVYFDRGVISGMVDQITKEVPGAQSKFLAGFLGGMFMVGYMLASPLFVRLSQISRAWKMYAILIGLGALAASAVFSYFAYECFIALLFLRMISGAGEAAFCSLAAPIIDESAPTGKKSLYVGIYFMFLYVGFGAGSASCFVFDSWKSGRILFLLEAGLVLICMAVFAGLRNRFKVPETSRDETGGLLQQLKIVMTKRVFVLLSLGYGAFFFAFGAFAFWVPTVIKQVYPDSVGIADLGFGAVTIVSGICGTAAGGFLMEILCRRLSARNSLKGLSDDVIRVLSGVAICAVLVFSGMLFTFPAVFSPNMYIFLLFFAVGTLLLFSTTAPVNIAIMYSVPAVLKPQAMAVSTGLSHLLGDFPSPFVIGAVIDALDYKMAMVVTSTILILPVLLWLSAGYYARKEGMEAASIEEKKPHGEVTVDA
jgi:MFS family permease